MTNEKNELSPSVRERIRKEARVRFPESGFRQQGFIAGAESERPKAIAAYREGLRKAVEKMRDNAQRGRTEASAGKFHAYREVLALLDQP